MLKTRVEQAGLIPKIWAESQAMGQSWHSSLGAEAGQRMVHDVRKIYANLLILKKEKQNLLIVYTG